MALKFCLRPLSDGVRRVPSHPATVAGPYFLWYKMAAVALDVSLGTLQLKVPALIMIASVLFGALYSWKDS